MKKVDEKEAKTLVIDEFHTRQGGFFKLPNGAYCHYSCGNPKTEKELSKRLEEVKVRKHYGRKSQMLTKKELYEIYKKQGGNKPLEELKNSEWTMLSVIYHLERAKENKNG